MFIFGHVGLTVAAAHTVDREVDLRWATLLAIAPDVLDKPIAWLAPVLVQHNTRNFGHTLAAALAVAAALWALRLRPRNPALLCACYAGHFLLDRMWLADNPTILFWPLLGGFPALRFDVELYRRLAVYNMLGELCGLALLVHLALRRRLFSPQRLSLFLKTGRATGDIIRASSPPAAS